MSVPKSHAFIVHLHTLMYVYCTFMHCCVRLLYILHFCTSSGHFYHHLETIRTTFNSFIHSQTLLVTQYEFIHHFEHKGGTVA